MVYRPRVDPARQPAIDTGLGTGMGNKIVRATAHDATAKKGPGRLVLRLFPGTGNRTQNALSRSLDESTEMLYVRWEAYAEGN